MKSTLLVHCVTVLLSAPASPVFAANAAVPLRPICGEVIINRILLATHVSSDGLDLLDTTHA